jgi:hypothetical protein
MTVTPDIDTRTANKRLAVAFLNLISSWGSFR